MVALSTTSVVQATDTASSDFTESSSLSLTVLALAAASLLAYVTAVPGLMLYYAGMVRRKNVLSVMMQCLALMFIMSVIWVGWGYSLAFSEDSPLGGFSHLALTGFENSAPPSNARLTHCFYFGASFVLATCLLCGSLVERMRLLSMLVFGMLWGTLVFCPLCHWTLQPPGVVGRGWFGHTFDFAGGQAVHLSAGVSALIGAVIVGRRLGYGMDDMRPHNLSYTTLGAAIIWMGAVALHFGAAIAGGTPETAMNAVLFTNLSMAGAAISWAGLEWIQRRKASVLGIASGAVAGFAGAAAGASLASAPLGILVGVASGAAAYSACGPLKNFFAYDDSLDVFGVHAVAGATGLLWAAILANPAYFGRSTPDAAAISMVGRVIGALVGMGLTTAYSASVTLLILKLLDMSIGLRVPQETEMRGLDLSQHGQEGYIFN